MIDTGSILFADFIVEGHLGSGGMGAVHLVRDASTNRRFAVKTSRFADARTQRAFLDELLVWIDLPQHPHITACHFFRTVGDRVAVFAECVEGGSLADWIADGEITRPGQALDVAIMSARGLAAIHDLGLVHQDVKPGNILVSVDGVAKITDFGLARAVDRAAPTETAATGNPRISAHGMTRAYCSPEQARREPLTPATDVWSWGVAMLELFVGEVTWLDGQVAAEALHAHLAQRVGTASRGAAMPEVMARILDRCFRPLPAQRWASMWEIDDALCRAFEATEGRAYAHPSYRVRIGTGRDAAGPATSEPAPARAAHDRGQTAPRAWLRRAHAAAGLDAPWSGPSHDGARSQRAMAVAVLAVYDEARVLYEALLAQGRDDLLIEAAGLLSEKAVVHASVEDEPGAIALYDRALDLFARRPDDEAAREGTALTTQRKAESLVRLQQYPGAAVLIDRALDLYAALDGDGVGVRRGDRTVALQLLKATVLLQQGQFAEARAMHDAAVSLAEQLVTRDGRPHLMSVMADAYMQKAMGLRIAGERHPAMDWYARAIDVYSTIVDETRGVPQRAELPLYTRHAFTDAEAERLRAIDRGAQIASRTAAQMDLALTRAELNDPSADALYAEAIAQWEQLVARDGRVEYQRFLAAAYANRANVLRTRSVPDAQAALGAYDRAIAIYERLHELEAMWGIAEALAVAMLDKATLVTIDGDARALSLYEGAIALIERAIARGEPRLRHLLAKATVNHAYALAFLGLTAQALDRYNAALQIYDRLLAEPSLSADVKADRAWALAARGRLLRGLGQDARGRDEMRAALRVLQDEAADTSRGEIAMMAAIVAKELAE